MSSPVAGPDDTATTSMLSHSKPAIEDKYKQLKRKLKEILEENDRFAHKLKKARSTISFLRREKDLLLDRIARYEGHFSASDSESSSASYLDESSEVSDIELTHNHVRNRTSSSGKDDRSSACSTAHAHLSARKLAKLSRCVGDLATPPFTEVVFDVNSPSIDAALSPMELSMNFNNVGDGTNMGEAEGAAPAAGPAHHQLHIQQVLQPPPKKKIKRGPVVTKLRRVQSVPTDELGRPVLPLQIGILTVHNLGTVVYDRDTYHNERYIYPVGYMISRQYFSMNDPNKTVMYTCSISDGGDGPRFHIIAEDAPDKPIVGFSATGAWTSVIRVANAIRKREHSNSASGPDYFGFSQPTVAKLIQDLPNAHKCKNYVWQEFEVIRGRGTKKVHTKLDNPSLFTTENGDGLPVSVAIAAAAAAAPPIMPRPITFVEEKPGKSPVSGEAREDDNSNAKESAVGDFPHRDHSCTVTGADLGGGGCEVGGLRASDAVEKVNDYEEVDVVSMDEDEDQENVNSHEQENDNGHEELSESSV